MVVFIVCLLLATLYLFFRQQEVDEAMAAAPRRSMVAALRCTCRRWR